MEAGSPCLDSLHYTKVCCPQSLSTLPLLGIRELETTPSSYRLVIPFLELRAAPLPPPNETNICSYCFFQLECGIAFATGSPL